MGGHGHAKWVFAAGLGGPDQHQDVPERQTGHVPQHQDACDPGNAVGDGSGLVEHHNLDLPK